MLFPPPFSPSSESEVEDIADMPELDDVSEAEEEAVAGASNTDPVAKYFETPE